MADNSKLRKQMGAKARETAQQYGMGQTEDIMRLVYNTLISEI